MLSLIAASLFMLQLHWEAPTHNVDGSPLVDLAQYGVRWGATPEANDNQIVLLASDQNVLCVRNLEATEHWVVMHSINSAGLASEPVSIGPVMPHLVGDINRDGRVNAIDLGLIKAAYFSGDGSMSVNALRADLDCDGMVNATDLGLLRDNFFNTEGGW